MVCLKDYPLVQKISQLHVSISTLDSLRPSEEVNALFTALVAACTPPHPIDVSNLCPETKAMRADLIRLCGQAEGLLEKHYSQILGTFQNPLDHLPIFPYYSNYLNLSRLEYALLRPHCPDPTRVAFLGSGPLPLTSIVLASKHMNSAVFHNYDIDGSANSMAEKLVASDPDLSSRMEFRTADVMDAASLGEYDVVFLAALVGMGAEEKARVVGRLAEEMAPGAILVARSAHGARAFLYPVVEARDLRGFEVLSVFHPTDEVINSVVVARKCRKTAGCGDKGLGPVIMPCSKCGVANKFDQPMKMIEDHIC